MKKIILLIAVILAFSFTYCDTTSSNSNNVSQDCTSVQCKGTTQKGDRCQNKTKYCDGYCYLHRP